MKYEPEYMPDELGEDKVFTLNSEGKAIELEVPDDEEECENVDND